METKNNRRNHGKSEKFKSYYVVWKPLWEAEKPIGHGVFKSYYVVWKQKMKIIVRNHSQV